MNLGHQLLQLTWRFIVATKKNHATSQGMTQPFAVGLVEALALDVEHNEPQRHSARRHFIAPVRPWRMPILFHETSRGDDAAPRGLRDSPATGREIRTPACPEHRWRH